MFLGATVVALFLQEQGVAEQFSIFLYYLLCIGVAHELMDGRVSGWLSRDILRLETLGQKLPAWFCE